MASMDSDTVPELQIGTLLTWDEKRQYMEKQGTVPVIWLEAVEDVAGPSVE
jgi:hypothetical protein